MMKVCNKSLLNIIQQSKWVEDSIPITWYNFFQQQTKKYPKRASKLCLMGNEKHPILLQRVWCSSSVTFLENTMQYENLIIVLLFINFLCYL